MRFSQVTMIGLSITLLTTFLPQLQSAAQPSNVPALTIAIDGPVYAGQPVWIRAVNLPPEYGVRYPFYTGIGYMGCNRLEVKHNGVLLTPRNFSFSSYEGIACGSSAPSGSPENRLPLHVLYPIDQPGTYSVRWTAMGRSAVPAQSQWLTFTALKATPQQHETWLMNLLATAPESDGQLAGDFLPSLVAAAPDPRALNTFIKYLYADNGVVSGMASSALESFAQPEVLRAVAESLETKGPSDQLAYFASYHTGWTLDDEEKIVRVAIHFLQPRDAAPTSRKQLSAEAPTQTAAAIKLLRFILYVPNHAWPASPELRSYSDAQVLQVAPDITENASVTAVQELAEYLGTMEYSPQAHSLLRRIAERNDVAGTQARICLTWLPQPEDLAHLAAFLTAPGDVDANGAERGMLAATLEKAYGEKALPYLEQSVASSPYIWVRVQSAQLLALHDRPIGFQFLLDQLVQDPWPWNHAYKPELIRWVCSNFPNDLPGDASEDAVISFLRERVARSTQKK